MSVRSSRDYYTLLLLKREWNSTNLIRSALRIKAFNWINRATPSINLNRLSLEQVANLLRRVPASFRRWPWEDKPKTPNSHIQRWNVENEYHVQSLLYSILSPVFPDLDDEVYTPPIGPKRPRADLTIPSLKLIIEVKYMYPSTSPQKMIEQIAEDCSLYLVEGSNYTKIIAFIWDAGPKPEQHDAMIKGMKQLDGIFDAIIMSRPSFMVASTVNKTHLSVSDETPNQE